MVPPTHLASVPPLSAVHALPVIATAAAASCTSACANSRPLSSGMPPQPRTATGTAIAAGIAASSSPPPTLPPQAATCNPIRDEGASVDQAAIRRADCSLPSMPPVVSATSAAWDAPPPPPSSPPLSSICTRVCHGLPSHENQRSALATRSACAAAVQSRAHRSSQAGEVCHLLLLSPLAPAQCTPIHLSRRGGGGADVGEAS